MAEIKSTLDMVMERAARMAAAADAQTDSDELHKTGMRMAADFLNEKTGDLATMLAERGKTEQSIIRKGMLETLLRNITLPRDENLKATSFLALKGILSLGGPDLSQICSELQQILDQYNQHKEQTTQQLEDAIRAQLGQQMARKGGQATPAAAINPALHPQYREELARMLSDLNSQYIQALDQRKEMIRQYMAPLA